MKEIDSFIEQTKKSNVSIIVPMYGFWDDIKDNPLLKEKVFSIVMPRVSSREFNYSIVFVAHPETIENRKGDKNCVANVMLGKSKAGNVSTIPVLRDATYNEYLNAGIEFVLNETKSEFIVIFNPWVMLQYGAIDAVIDRANRGDDARVVCGKDIRKLVSPDEFDEFKNVMLPEEWDISTDLICFPRFIYEVAPMDMGYKTHKYLAQDFAHNIKKNGFASINYPPAGMFPFDFNWKQYEEDDEEDKERFATKWGFAV